MQTNIQKFSVVYVTTGEGLEVFKSLEEMPEELRLKLIRTARTSEVNTLVIANEKGRRFLETQGFSRLPKPAQPGPAAPLWETHPWLRYAALAFIASGLGALLLWLFPAR